MPANICPLHETFLCRSLLPPQLAAEQNPQTPQTPKPKTHIPKKTEDQKKTPNNSPTKSEPFREAKVTKKKKQH